MQFDINNKVVKLCSEGMELEGQGRKKEYPPTSPHLA